MIAPLLAFVQLFAADPTQCFRDMQRVHEQPFDLRSDHVSVSFQPQIPITCRFESFRSHCEFDGRSGSYVQIMDDFPSFFSDATVTNRDRGLDVYSQVD
jgi:hypothetical protein